MPIRNHYPAVTTAYGVVLRVSAALLLAGCGESVVDHIDALREAGTVHEALLPPGPGPGLPDGPRLSSRLREDEDGRALLDDAHAAVPDLIRLLDDPDRHTLAAAFLAEIGGPAAAQGLLDEWRELRHQAKRKCLFTVPDVGASLGSRYENVDGEFYGELLDALCYAGRDASTGIARDTDAALRECERMEATEADLILTERRDEGGRLIELRWRPEPVETAREGLMVLAASGAPEAVGLVARALRLRTLRRTGLKCIVHLGERAEPLLPDLARLLEDPECRDETRRQLAILADSIPERQRKAMAHRYGQLFGSR